MVVIIGKCNISIHALREEGDTNGKHAQIPRYYISIHALREEGDDDYLIAILDILRFLSTPSVRRATYTGYKLAEFNDISIHALREEGDDEKNMECTRPDYFYPRPP